MKYFWIPKEVWYYVVFPIFGILMFYLIFNLFYSRKKGTYYYNYVIDYVYSVLGIIFCGLLICLLLGYSIAMLQILYTNNLASHYLFLIIILVIIPIVPIVFLIYVIIVFVQNFKRKEILDKNLEAEINGDNIINTDISINGEIRDKNRYGFDNFSNVNTYQNIEKEDDNVLNVDYDREQIFNKNELNNDVKIITEEDNNNFIGDENTPPKTTKQGDETEISIINEEIVDESSSQIINDVVPKKKNNKNYYYQKGKNNKYYYKKNNKNSFNNNYNYKNKDNYKKKQDNI